MSKTIRRGALLAAALAPLGAFLLMQAVELGYFIRHENRPPGWDQANHLDVALQYARALGAGNWAVLWNLEPKHYIPPFPPLYHLALAWVYATAHPAWNALWTNGVYLGLLCAFLFALAWERCRDDRAAAAAIVFACVPAVQALLHRQLIDLPLCACAAAAYWAWVRCEGFLRPKPSAALGLAFAVGMLHKWSFFSYMLPVLFAAALGLREKDKRRNIGVFVLGACLAAPWYMVRIPLLAARLLQASADQATPFWRGWAFFQYLALLPEELGVFFCLAALVALFHARSDRRCRDLAACAWVSYLFWAVVPNRQMRYLLPGLTVLPVLIAWHLPRPAVWILALLQFAGAAHRAYEHGPSGQVWPLEDIVRAASGGSEGLSVVSNHEYLNNLNLIWTARCLGLSTRIQAAQNKLWELEPFVLLKRRDLGPYSVSSESLPIREAILRPGGAFSLGFVATRTWPLPDGDEAILYARREPLPEPFRAAKRVRARRWKTALFSFADVELRFGRWDAASGVYETVQVAPAKASLRGRIELSGVRLELLGARLLPEGNASAPEDLRLLKVQGIRVLSAGLDAAPLLRGSFKGVPFSARARIDCSRSEVGVRLTSLRLAGIAVPAAVLDLGPLLELDSSRGVTVIQTPYWAGLKREFPFALSVDCAGLKAAGAQIVDLK